MKSCAHKLSGMIDRAAFSRIASLYWIVLPLAMLAGCAAGNTRFDHSPAGFWAGLWHGLIMVITFIVSLFTHTVKIYETNNVGGWYNFGFVLGAIIALGGSRRATCRRSRRRLRDLRDSEWAEISRRVEEKVDRAINDAVQEGKPDREWEEIGRKIEEKIKRELRDWADR